MKLLTQILISTLAIMFTTYLLPHVHVDAPWHAFLVAILLAGLNMLVKPILVVFTLPITIFTLGLFLIIINGIMVMMVDYLMDGFKVDNLLWAIIFSVILTGINTILQSVLGTNNR
ncbi:MAG: phage holin family protein [Bacteroidia bacterium]|nr:phage holin family protein [Bacteroidia bacterium]HQU99910.1 phage holin family protein [Bacteroidia bacterium]